MESNIGKTIEERVAYRLLCTERAAHSKLERSNGGEAPCGDRSTALPFRVEFDPFAQWVSQAFVLNSSSNNSERIGVWVG